MRKNIWTAFLLILILCACESEQEKASRQVRMAAQDYYSALLIDSEYEEFLSGIVDADSLPEGYRSQLHDMFRQYVAEQNEGGGVVQVTATADSMNGSHATVFLELMFADSTMEQVSVQMMKADGKWMMK